MKIQELKVGSGRGLQQGLESERGSRKQGLLLQTGITHSGFVADTTFDYMLMHLAFHVDRRLTDSTGNHGGAPTIRASQG